MPDKEIHAHWDLFIEENTIKAICSNCKYVPDQDENYSGVCPNCQAIMNEREEN